MMGDSGGMDWGKWPPSPHLPCHVQLPTYTPPLLGVTKRNTVGAESGEEGKGGGYRGVGTPLMTYMHA